MEPKILAGLLNQALFNEVRQDGPRRFFTEKFLSSLGVDLDWHRDDQQKSFDFDRFTSHDFFCEIAIERLGDSFPRELVCRRKGSESDESGPALCLLHEGLHLFGRPPVQDKGGFLVARATIPPEVLEELSEELAAAEAAVALA